MENTKGLSLSRKEWLFLLGLISASWLIYWKARYGLPLADHLVYQREQLYTKTDWEFFWRTLSFDRTGTQKSLSNFCFRPLKFAYHSFFEVFFSDRTIYNGLASLTLHAVAVFSAFLALRQVIPRVLAYVASAILLVQFSGMEMILWRHISPYLFALTSIFGALLSFKKAADSSDAKVSKRFYRIGSYLIFFSSCFHEMAALTGFTLGGILLLLYRKSPERQVERALAKAMFLPSAIYLGWNVIDYILRHPMVHFTDALSERDTGAYDLIDTLFETSGVFAIGALFPFAMKFRPNENPWQWQWQGQFAYFAPDTLVILGIISLCIVSFVAYQAFRRFEKNARDTRAFYVTFFAFALLIVTTGFAWGRVVLLNGKSYYAIGTYYFYIAVFCFVMSVLPWMEEKVRAFPTHLRNGVTAIAAVYGLAYLISSVVGIRTLTGIWETDDVLVGKTASAVADYLEAHPGNCFAGSLGFPQEDRRMPLILMRKSCVLKSGTPVFSYLAPDNQLKMGAIEDETTEPLTFKNMPEKFDSQIFSYTPQGPLRLNLSLDPFQPGESAYSDKVYDSDFYGFKSKDLDTGGLVIGYRDPRNFILLAQLRHHDFGLFEVADGKTINHFGPYHVGNPPEVQLELKRIGPAVFLMKDRVVVQRIDTLKPERLAGRVGVFGVKGTKIQNFTEFYHGHGSGKLKMKDPTQQSYAMR